MVVPRLESARATLKAAIPVPVGLPSGSGLSTSMQTVKTPRPASDRSCRPLISFGPALGSVKLSDLFDCQLDSRV